MLIVVITCTGGCSKPCEPAPASVATASGAVNAELQVLEAVRRLLECSTQDGDCFVIVQEQLSGKFVQFAGSIDEPLLLDLPLAALSPQETTRAEALTIGSNTLTKRADSFQLSCGRDAEFTAKVAMAVFRDVYRLSDNAELTISRR